MSGSLTPGLKDRHGVVPWTWEPQAQGESWVFCDDCITDYLPPLSLPFSAMQENSSSGSYGNSGNCGACSWQMGSFELSQQRALFMVTALKRVHIGQTLITFSKA